MNNAPQTSRTLLVPCIDVVSRSPTTFDVSVCSTSSLAEVDVYRVTTKYMADKTCSISAGSASKTCKLTGLEGGTEYTVSLAACDSVANVCSYTNSTVLVTIPNGEQCFFMRRPGNCDHKYLFAFQLEPACLEAAIEPNGTEMTAKICPPAGNPELGGFYVKLLEGTPSQKCVILAEKRFPKECDISGLKPGTTYTVQAQGCADWLEKKPICSDWISSQIVVPNTVTTTSGGSLHFISMKNQHLSFN